MHTSFRQIYKLKKKDKFLNFNRHQVKQTGVFKFFLENKVFKKQLNGKALKLFLMINSKMIWSKFSINKSWKMKTKVWGSNFHKQIIGLMKFLQNLNNSKTNQFSKVVFKKKSVNIIDSLQNKLKVHYNKIHLIQ